MSNLDLLRANVAAAEQEHEEAAAELTSAGAALESRTTAYEQDPTDKSGREVIAARDALELAKVRVRGTEARLDVARLALASAEGRARLAELIVKASREQLGAALDAETTIILKARAAERAALAKIDELVAAHHAAHGEARALAAQLGERCPIVAAPKAIGAIALDLATLEAMTPAERAAKVDTHGTREAMILRRVEQALGISLLSYPKLDRREAIAMRLAGATLADVGEVNRTREAAEVRAQLAAALTPPSRAFIAKRLIALIDDAAERAELEQLVDDGAVAEDDIAAAERAAMGKGKSISTWGAAEREAFWSTYTPRSKRPGAVPRIRPRDAFAFPILSVTIDGKSVDHNQGLRAD